MEPIHILMVEDNEGDVLLTTQALKQAKLSNRISVVRDGVDALEFLHQRGQYEGTERPDLILLDLNMPRKDGRQVLLDIKADDELKQIPVVVLTSSKAEQDVVKAYDLHANCYVVKPVDFVKLMEVVHAIEQFWLSVVRLPAHD